MCARSTVVALLSLLLRAVHAQDSQNILIGVVEHDPVLAQHLGASVEAALGAEGTAAVAPVEPEEPLALPAHVCATAGEGAAAAVAGAGGARLAAAAAARAGLPLLLVEPAPVAASWEALSMFPHPDVLARACADLCVEKEWEEAVLLHDGGAEGAALVAPEPKPLALLARQLPPPEHTSLLRNLLLVLKKLGRTKFIVWCSAACVERVLEAAQRVGLLAQRHAYVVLALDLHTLDLDPYSHGGANITGLRLFDPGSAGISSTMEAWNAAYARRLGDAADAAEAARTVSAPPTALVLAHHAARLVKKALEELRLPPMAPADCANAQGAFHADTLLNYLRSEEWKEEDSDGPISWDADGGRRDLQLEVVELARGGQLRREGVWAPAAGLVWQRSEQPAPAPPPDSMTNRTFNVLIAVNKPYVMKTESHLRLSGNARYEGYCIELIERLAEILHFNYTFIEHSVGGYGSLNPETKEWTGMLGRLINDESMDFAITDMTITEERERAVDFTTPFMNLGISILFRKPKAAEPELFAFLLPFSNGVWLCLGFAYLGTSLILYVVGRLCHEEWQNPYPCIEEPPALENQFTLANALWFNLGAVLLQGSEIAPVAYGTRAVAGVWWVFALVITSSYTANLATLLAKPSADQLISSVDDLVYKDLGIDYGAKANGSTYTFFQQSKDEKFKKMYEHMKTKKQPTSNEDGINRVNETYAFLMESTTIEYETERNCKVTKVGGLLDSKGYGIAMKKGSVFLQPMNLALLKLQEAGTLRDMKNSWWMEKHGGGACKAQDERSSAELSMANFRGLFLVLTVGCALGVALTCLDLVVVTARRARARDEPFARHFAAEMRFVFRFENSVKPINGPLSETSSGSAAGEGESLTAQEARSLAGEAEEAEVEGSVRLRTGSFSRVSSRRRRSSIHAASLRLARHTAAARGSVTPSQRSLKRH